MHAELRYGVLWTLALKVFERRAIDVTMGMANVIWQGDANSACLQSLAHCQTPPLILNLTGPEHSPSGGSPRNSGGALV